MKLEEQVCSLELAKKLKELGVKQDSLFYYEKDEYQFWYDRILRTAKPDIKMEGEAIDTREGDYFNHDENSISAFTVAELGEMLPDEYPGDSDSNLLIFKAEAKDLVHWYIRYENDVQEMSIHTEFAETEANARAKMLIYLLENKLIDKCI